MNSYNDDTMDFREGKDIIGHLDDLFCRERQRDVSE